MDVFQAIFERRSIRVFDESRPIPPDVFLKILNAVRYIPALPHAEYPFRFIVVNDQETRESIALSAKEVASMLFGASFEVFGNNHLWYFPEKVRLKVAEYTTTGELWTYPREVDLVPVYSESPEGRFEKYYKTFSGCDSMEMYLFITIRSKQLYRNSIIGKNN